MGNTSDNNGAVQVVAPQLGWLVGSLSLSLTPADWDWLVARARAVAEDGAVLVAVDKRVADFAAAVGPKAEVRC